jgi:hypothetical protein
LLRCWAAWAMAKPKFLGEDLFLEWEGLQTWTYNCHICWIQGYIHIYPYISIYHIYILLNIPHIYPYITYPKLRPKPYTILDKCLPFTQKTSQIYETLPHTHFPPDVTLWIHLDVSTPAYTGYTGTLQESIQRQLFSTHNWLWLKNA